MRFNSIVLAVCATLATPAFAADNSTWEISGAIFAPKTSLDLSADGSVTDGTTTVFGSTGASLNDDAFGGQVEAIWRPTARQRVDAQFYRISGDRRYNVNEAFTGTDGATTADLVVDGTVRIDTDFELYSLGYGFDVLQGDVHTVTALVGVYGASLDSRAVSNGEANLTVTEPGPVVTSATVDLSGSIRDSVTRYAPGFGLATAHQLSDRWEVRTRAQGFKTSWGNFSSQDGRFYSVDVELGFDVTDQLTTFVGYNWFDLKLDDEFGEEFVDAGTVYVLDGEARGRLRVHGPTLGARWSF